jgi:hypothetical protein
LFGQNNNNNNREKNNDFSYLFNNNDDINEEKEEKKDIDIDRDVDRVREKEKEKEKEKERERERERERDKETVREGEQEKKSNNEKKGFFYMGNSSQRYVDNFLISNNLVSKFAYVILILIIFIVVCDLGIFILGYFSSTQKENPYIISGLSDGSNPIVIAQDPSDKSSIPIYRSHNQNKGIEFSWCLWLLLEGNQSLPKIKYQNIFNKGDSYYDKINGISTVNNGPGLYVSSLFDNENILHVVMDTVNVKEGPTIIDISNIPFKKWFHVCIRLENKSLDVYINGIITKRHTMISVPKQNYNDINICQNGGFSGKLSSFRYYAYGLSSLEISTLMMGGPNLNTSNSTNLTSPNYSSFLSNSWFN